MGFSAVRPVEQAEAALDRAALVCFFAGILEFILGFWGFVGLFSGLAHVFLGYGVWRRSRAAAVVLLMESAGSVLVCLMSGGGLSWNLTESAPSLLVAGFAVPAARAAFAYHEHLGSRLVVENVLRKGAAAFCYTTGVYSLLSVAALLIAPALAEGSPRALAILTSLPTFLTLAAALDGRLPFTRDLPLAKRA